MYLIPLITLLVALIEHSQANFDCTNVPGNGTIDIDACSNFPIFFDEPIMTKCNNDFPDSDGLPIGICTAQCLLNATNLIVIETGKINRPLFENMISTKSVGDWSTVSASATNKCYQLTEAKDEALNQLYISLQNGPHVCHPQPSYIIACLYTELFVNTPDSAFNENSISECPALKDFVKNCAIE